MERIVPDRPAPDPLDPAATKPCAICESVEHRTSDHTRYNAAPPSAADVPDLDPAAVEAAREAWRQHGEWASLAAVESAITAYLDRSGLAETEAEIKTMLAETEQRLIAKVDALVAERDEARASLAEYEADVLDLRGKLQTWERNAGEYRAELAEARASLEREKVNRDRDGQTFADETDRLRAERDEAVARAEAAERERAIERTSVDQLLAELAEARSVVARLEAENAELREAVDRAHAAMNDSQYVGGPTEREAWRTAYDALCEVATQHQGQPVDEAKARGFRHRPDSHRADHG